MLANCWYKKKGYSSTKLVKSPISGRRATNIFEAKLSEYAETIPQILAGRALSPRSLK